ncbi:Trm112 family protein [Thermocrinis sp.]
MSLSKELLDILACPKCKGDLRYDEKRSILICERCGVFYRIVDEIPILTPDSAEQFPEPEEALSQREQS